MSVAGAVATPKVLRVWGANQLQPLVRRWEQGLRKLQAGVRVEARLTGSDVTLAGLYTGFADVALLGRESTAVESKAFEWIFRYPPAQVEIMTGSLERLGQSPALVAFVHRDNPLSQLTLLELDAIFGHERLSGVDRNVRTWGGLGLTGEWADHLIRLYAHDTETGTGRYFRRTVLGDSRKMNWEQLTEFNTRDAQSRILRAVAADRYGLGIACGSGDSVPQVKALALARSPGDDFVRATRENLISRRYPLTRTIHAYFNRPPDTPADSRVAGFLRYILSRQGQQDVIDGGDYLPLSEERAQQQLQKLA